MFLGTNLGYYAWNVNWTLKNNTKPEQTQHLATQYQQVGTHYKSTLLPSDAIILPL